MRPLLRVEKLVVSYGPIEAVRGIDFVVNEGEITAMIGANGAGKSSTLLCISGFIKARQGQLLFEGEDLGLLPAHCIVERGVVQVCEGRAILTSLTVRENLDLGSYVRKDSHRVKHDLEWVFSLFPVLRQRASHLAGNLSGGEQQMLAIGRALMAKPRLLLLDEPSMGLAPLLVQEIFKVLQQINQQGITILIIEQNVQQVLKIAQQGLVMETGQIVLRDTGKNLLSNPKVVDAYLGITNEL